MAQLAAEDERAHVDGDQIAAAGPVPLIDRPSSGDLVAIHVRSLIFNGELRQGDRVHQDDIARQSSG